jgi:hypothetical protein
MTFLHPSNLTYGLRYSVVRINSRWGVFISTATRIAFVHGWVQWQLYSFDIIILHSLNVMRKLIYSATKINPRHVVLISTASRMASMHGTLKWLLIIFDIIALHPLNVVCRLRYSATIITAHQSFTSFSFLNIFIFLTILFVYLLQYFKNDPAMGAEWLI